MLALLDDRVAAHLDLGIEAVEAGERSAAERARSLGDALTQALLSQRQWHVLFLELWQRALRHADLKARFAARRHEQRALLAAAIEGHAAALGLTPAMSPEDLATVILALSNGLAIEAYPDPDAVPRHLFGRVLELLLAPATT